MTTDAKWVKHPSGLNEVLYCDGFAISYNPDLRVLGEEWAGNSPTHDETALVRGGSYKILNGDFRGAYERIAPLGYHACLEFYEQQAAHSDSEWSGR